MDIMYEDSDYVVVNKPAGLMVHEDGRSGGPFLTDWILENYPKTKNVGEPMKTPEGKIVIRPGIVHRLDRETTGAIIFAKNKKAHAHLKKQFQDKTVSKKYLAFVWGEMKEEFGTITRPIGRSGKDFRKWSAQRGIRGETREAETYWTRMGTGVVGKDKFTLIEAQPKTGRTHQIRVHMLAINHPVVSDFVYAPNQPSALGFERLALHSQSIEFENLNGERVRVEAPLPKDFVNAGKLLGLNP